ncbi:MAG TPA: hypothetical protein VJ957_01600 [Longimicrobiales bacterium]|nr:hypothetical protein [Longimicrobiales bacterium]
MKVLHAAALDDNPAFGHFQAAAAAQGIDLEFSVEAFWRGEPAGWDVLHLQWPEALFGWRAPTTGELSELHDRLNGWRRATRVAALVHNSRPHYSTDPGYEALYDTVFQAVDGVVHMGRASLVEYEARYPHLRELPHAIVPLGLASAFRANVSRDDARGVLRLRPEDFVVTAFGALRHTEEIRLLLKGFGRTRVKRKRLVVAARKIPLAQSRTGTALLLARIAADPRMRLSVGRLPDDRVPVYVNAADVLVLPRKQVMSSGVVPLGFTVGRVVVGPARGVVGEILAETGNPTFDPERPGSLAMALEEGRRLARAGKGEWNRAYGQTHWSWDRIASLYADFYRTLNELPTGNDRRT